MRALCSTRFGWAFLGAVCVACVVCVACGAEPPPRPVVARAIVRDASAEGGDALGDAGDPLALDPSELAPGMREIVREEIIVAEDTKPITIPTSSDADTCVRVAVRSIGAVRARLVGPRGAMAEGATLGERGPICVRRGEHVVLELRASERARARVVAWSSP